MSRKKKLAGLDWTGSHVNTEGRAAAPATNMAALVGWEASQARNIKTDLGCLGVTTGGQVVRSSR